jgi:hypothetical protein
MIVSMPGDQFLQEEQGERLEAVAVGIRLDIKKDFLSGMMVNTLEWV